MAKPKPLEKQPYKTNIPEKLKHTKQHPKPEIKIDIHWFDTFRLKVWAVLKAVPDFIIGVGKGISEVKSIVSGIVSWKWLLLIALVLAIVIVSKL